MSDADGCWEFPGGRLDEDETAIQAAMREWEEETGLKLPDGDLTGHWVSDDGKYEGYIMTIPHEADLDLESRDEVPNPDDHGFEPLAWWDPDQLEDNDSIREEILDDLDILMPMLKWAVKGGGMAGFDSRQKRPDH